MAAMLLRSKSINQSLDHLGIPHKEGLEFIF
jgi:hypothetical protein